MPTPLLKTKLYIPPTRAELVSRPRLLERLNAGLDRKLTLISAPAGFGKTTLLSEWVAACGLDEPKVRVAWLSLDEGDNEPSRFLAYLKDPRGSRYGGGSPNRSLVGRCQAVGADRGSDPGECHRCLFAGAKGASVGIGTRYPKACHHVA